MRLITALFPLAIVAPYHMHLTTTCIYMTLLGRYLRL